MAQDEQPASMEELKSVAMKAADALWAYDKDKSGPGDVGIGDKVYSTLKRTGYSRLHSREGRPLLYKEEDAAAHLTAELIALMLEAAPMLEALDEGRSVSGDPGMLNHLIYNRLYHLRECEPDPADGKTGGKRG